MKKATWMWNFTDICQNSDMYVRFMAVQGVTDIYLQFTMSTTFDRSAYRSLIKSLTRNGIRAHATNGASNWVNNQQYALRFLDLVHEYNRTCEIDEMFCGVHLDVEPYTLPEWITNQGELVSRWTSLIKTYASYAEIPVSAAMPFWFHNLGEEFLLAVLNSHDHIALMSYRNIVEGPNSLTTIIQPTLDLMAFYKPYANVIVGMETIPVNEGPMISYCDRNIKDLNLDMRTITRKYNQAPHVAGIAIHSLNGWMALNQISKTSI